MGASLLSVGWRRNPIPRQGYGMLVLERLSGRYSGRIEEMPGGNDWASRKGSFLKRNIDMSKFVAQLSYALELVLVLAIGLALARAAFGNHDWSGPPAPG